MIGKYSVCIQNSLVRFKFEIERNITIIRGNSGTGKTTLVEMVLDYQSQGKSSGIELICDKKCVAMSGLGVNWQNFLNTIQDSIVFIDEGESYVRTKDFAKFIRNTDNYYVIATRDNLYEIPYSVDAIFEVKSSGKYGKLKKTYNHFERIYGERVDLNLSRLEDYKLLITEDSNSGYDFWSKICQSAQIDCETAGGKSNILAIVNDYLGIKMLIVADGAAFGPEMANVFSLTSQQPIQLFLPESFEWLILNSGIVKDARIREILEEPYNYIESKKYFSWELFFAELLVNTTKGTEYQYRKKRLNDYYMSEKSIKRIIDSYFEVP